MSALQYKKLQSKLYVELLGAHTFNGSDQDLKVLNMEAAPFELGFHSIMLVLQNASLTGDVTVTAQINPETNGSGTDVNVQSIVLDQSASHTELTYELVPELVSKYADANDIIVRSVVFKVNGTNLDTADAALVVKCAKEEDNLTGCDPTSVTAG